MELLDIQHVAIRTKDVDATNHFYTELLGMTFAKRPPMNFPGSWLLMGTTMIHVVGGDAARDADGSIPSGSAAVDHLALAARGFDAYKSKFEEAGVTWKENALTEAGLWQLFVQDPSGILVELNFNVADEPAGSKGVENDNDGAVIRF